MADTSGFNLTRLKQNLAQGSIDTQSLFLPFLKAKRTAGINGLSDTQIEKAIKSLEGQKNAEPIPSNVKSAMESAIGATISSQEFVNQEFHNLLVDETKKISGKASDEDAQKIAGRFGDEISKAFSSRYGREASQPEIAAIFNRTNYSGTADPANEAEVSRLIDSGKANILGRVLPELDDKLPIIEQANLSLKNIGQSLSQEDLNSLLSEGVTPERADVLSRSLVQQKLDADVKTKSEALKPERLKAIDQLEQSLSGSQTKALTEDFAPAIVSALRARGLSAGPELSNVLGDISGKLTRDRTDTLGTLRSQAMLSAPEDAFNLALNNAGRSNQGLTMAQNFLQNSNFLGKQQNFAAGQSALNRQSQQDMWSQQAALQMAMQGGTPQGPGALDYFLGYGLPALTSIATAGIAGPAAGAGAGWLTSYLTGLRKKN